MTLAGSKSYIGAWAKTESRPWGALKCNNSVFNEIRAEVGAHTCILYPRTYIHRVVITIGL